MSPKTDDCEEVFGELNLEKAESTKRFCHEIETQITQQILDGIVNMPKEKLDLNDERIKSKYKKLFTYLLNPSIALTGFDIPNTDENCFDDFLHIERIDLLPKHRVFGQNYSLELDILLPELPQDVDSSYSEGKIIQLEREKIEEDVFLRELLPGPQYKYTFIINQGLLINDIETAELDRFSDALEKIASITKDK